MSFKGKVVIITGAGSGIGRATAKKLHSLGASLALCDISGKGLQETCELCDNESFTMIVDVSNSDQINDFVSQTVSKFQRIDHVFNNAGVNPTAIPLEDTTDEYWDKLMNTNVKGTFNMTRSTIPHLRSGASFVNVSSIMGVRGSARVAVYCATKWAIIGFSKSMALELGPRGIRTNVVAPGNIDTPTNTSVVDGPEAVKRSAEACSLGRLGTADEVADTVAFLFSDESRYMNGSVVELNGGL